MMVLAVLLLTLLSGLLVLLVKGVGWFMRFVTVPFCLGLLGFGALSGIRFLLLFLMRILLFGLSHWPAHGGDLGVGGVSYVELLIFV